MMDNKVASKKVMTSKSLLERPGRNSEDFDAKSLGGRMLASNYLDQRLCHMLCMYVIEKPVFWFGPKANKPIR